MFAFACCMFKLPAHAEQLELGLTGFACGLHAPAAVVVTAGVSS
jgi:hypothetical protein